jgi:fimbrial chaperone protein
VAALTNTSRRRPCWRARRRRASRHTSTTLFASCVHPKPIASEESYRIVIDEIPSNPVKRTGTINLVIRHSIPVFFRSPQAGMPKVSWRLTQSGGKLKLVAENAGGTRLRLADLSLQQGNAHVFMKKGLVG